MNLQSCVVCSISDGTGVGTIKDDDTPIISIGDVSISEGNAGDTNFDFKVTRTGGLGSFSVNLEQSRADRRNGHRRYCTQAVPLEQ